MSSDYCLEKDCGMPVEEVNQFVIGGTHDILFRRVRCLMGHHYMEELASIETPLLNFDEDGKLDQ